MNDPARGDGSRVGESTPADGASPAGDATFAAEALPEMEAVHRFALRLSGDPDQARDLVQDTFLRAYRSWASFTPGTRIRSWLFTICRNLYFRARERELRFQEIARVEGEERPGDVALDATVFRATRDHDPEGTFWSRVVDEEVLRAVASLPIEFREAVVLNDMEGLPYAEIGEVLGVPVGTAKSRVFRGRRLLQELLHDYAVSVGILPGSGTVPDKEDR